MVRTNPIRYLLSKPILSGRLAKWSLQLAKFDITCMMPSGIKWQAMINMLASFSSEEEIPTVEEIPRELPETACAATTSDWWSLLFDG